MTLRFRGALLALLVMCAGTARVTSAQDRIHDITIEVDYTQTSITDCALSPDGSLVAYTESRWLWGLH